MTPPQTTNHIQQRTLGIPFGNLFHKNGLKQKAKNTFNENCPFQFLSKKIFLFQF